MCVTVELIDLQISNTQEFQCLVVTLFDYFAKTHTSSKTLLYKALRFRKIDRPEHLPSLPLTGTPLIESTLEQIGNMLSMRFPMETRHNETK